MLEVFPQNIQFLEGSKLKDIELKNKSTFAVIFKIKTNKINTIDAKPNTGCIKPNQTIQISIKKLTPVTENTKIQIKYTRTPDINISKETIRQIWNQQKQFEKDIIVPISDKSAASATIHQAKHSDKTQSFQNDEISKSTIYRSVNRVSEIQEGKKEVKKVEITKQENKAPNIIRDRVILQQKNADEAIQNHLMKNRIQQNQSAIRKQEEEKSKEEKKVGAITCTSLHLDKKYLVVMAIVLLTIGFLIGRNSS